MSETLQAEVPTREMRDRLFAFVFSRVRSREVAEDLTQEVLLKATLALEHTQVANLDGWLFGVARNTVAEYFRASRDHVEWNEAAHGESTRAGAESKEEAMLRAQLAAYVRGVVEGLREPHREALMLTEYEGLTQPELAERLGISLTAAKSRVQRARAEVRRVIEECCRVATDAYGQVTECTRKSATGCDCGEE